MVNNDTKVFLRVFMAKKKDCAQISVLIKKQPRDASLGCIS